MNFDKIPSRQKLEEQYHKSKMRGVDNNVSYTTDGEYIIPKPVMEKFPAMAMGIMQATADVGLDPEQFMVGSDKGVYNPDTGAQEFGHVWYHFEIDDLTKTINDIGTKLVDSAKESYTEFLDDPLDNRFVQSSIAGLGSAAVAKLSGASTDQAIQTGIGGALAYGALPESTEDTPISTSDRLFAGLAGAYGAYQGYQPPLEDEPIQGANNPVPSNYADILPTAPVPGFDQNEQANVSLGLPSKVPPAPFTAMDETPDGVNYKRKVKDRKTGAFNYVDSAPTSSFGRNVNTEGRRGGLSPGFGSKVLYIDD